MKIESFCKKWALLFFLLIIFGCNSSSGGGGDKPDESDVQSPSKPEAVSTPEISSGKVSLSWPAASDNVGVARYRIYRNGSMIAESGETSYIDTALPDPGRYCYAVSAIDEAGNESEKSPETCVDIPPPPDTEPPSVPAGVSTSVIDSGVRITWSASTDNKAVAGYRIFRNGVKISDLTETSFSDSSVSPGARYCYTVSAFDGSGNESAQSSGSCVDSPVARDVQPPSIPANLKCTSSASSHDLSWSASTDNVAVTGYRIYRNSTYLATVTVTCFSDEDINPTVLKCYAVSSIDAAGNESIKSDEACLNALAGRIKWKLELEDNINECLALSSGGTLYLSTANGVLYGINPDGSVKWKYTDQGLEGTFPIIAHDGSIILGSKDYIHSVDAEGNKKWKFYAPDSNAAKAPALSTNGTIFTDVDSGLYLINPDGSLKFRIDMDSRLFFPVMGQRGSIHKKLRANSPAAIDAEGICYVPYTNRGPFGEVYSGKIRAEFPDGTAKWEKGSSPDTPAAFYTPAMGSDGTIYSVTSDGYLWAMSSSGEMKWKKEVGLPAESPGRIGYSAATPSVGSDGVIHIQTRTGLHALRPDGSPLWDNNEAAGFSYPAISSYGVIYAASGKTVYAVFTESRGLASSPCPKFRNDNRNAGNQVAVDTGGRIPSTPLNATAISAIQNMIRLEWKPSTGNPNPVIGYKLYRNEEYIGTTGNNNYMDSGLSPSTSYNYKIKAFDIAGNESEGATVTTETKNSAIEGEPKWELQVENTLLGAPPALLVDGTILTNQHAVSPAGVLKWKKADNNNMYSPTVGADGFIYYGPFQSLYPDGGMRWSRSDLSSGIKTPSSMGLDETIYSGTTDGYLRAFNSDGTNRWSYNTGVANNYKGRPSIGSDSTIYLASPDCTLRAINPDGTIKWIYSVYAGDEVPVQSGNSDRWISNPSIAKDGSIYLISAYRDGKVLFSLRSDGSLKWKYELGVLAVDESITIDPEGTAYIGGTVLQAVKPDGTLKWSLGYDLWASTPTIGADGTLYSFSENRNTSDGGNICAINPDGSLKWKYNHKGSEILGRGCSISSDGTLYFAASKMTSFAIQTGSMGFAIATEGLNIDADGNYHFDAPIPTLFAIKTGSAGLAAGGWPRICHDNQNTGRMP